MPIHSPEGTSSANPLTGSPDVSIHSLADGHCVNPLTGRGYAVNPLTAARTQLPIHSRQASSLPFHSLQLTNLQSTHYKHMVRQSTHYSDTLTSIHSLLDGHTSIPLTVRLVTALALADIQLTCTCSAAGTNA